ncbi:hypothetical protein CR513_32326, partial [Mucuna pruriens]
MLVSLKVESEVVVVDFCSLPSKCGVPLSIGLSDVASLEGQVVVYQDAKCDFWPKGYAFRSRCIIESFNLSHHLSKANVVANALIKKSLDLRDSILVCEVTLKSIKLGMLKVTSDLMEESRECYKLGLVITHEKRIGVKIRTDDVMRFYDNIHVLDVTKLRKLILQRGLSSGLSARLGAMRTYQNLREMFERPGLKEE